MNFLSLGGNSSKLGKNSSPGQQYLTSAQQQLGISVPGLQQYQQLAGLSSFGAGAQLGLQASPELAQFYSQSSQVPQVLNLGLGVPQAQQISEQQLLQLALAQQQQPQTSQNQLEQLFQNQQLLAQSLGGGVGGDLSQGLSQQYLTQALGGSKNKFPSQAAQLAQLAGNQQLAQLAGNQHLVQLAGNQQLAFGSQLGQLGNLRLF